MRIENKSLLSPWPKAEFAFSPYLHMLKSLVHKTFWIIFAFLFCGWVTTANADTYQLTDGTSINGDVISFNDDGVTFHTTDDKYTDRIPWTKFSQDSLKNLAKNPKIAPLAEPFIEIPPPAPSQTHVTVHDVTRLQLPPKGSVIGGLFTSSLGIVLLLLIYAANIYAGYEVAVFRARPPSVVIFTAAVLPILGPIIFLSLPTVMPAGATEEDMQTATGAPPEAVAPANVPQDASASAPQTEADAAPATGLHVAATGWQAATAIPETQVFQRGQFTFNRRFLETKFSSFFGISRHGADKDMVLLVKTPKGQHIVERITRISANDAYFEVAVGAGRQEVMVPFGEIQEIQLKHKNA
jgi:hypothetical protein